VRSSRLKDELIQIELAIKSNELDKASELYAKINQNWGEYQKELSQEDVPELLRLVDYIEELLKEKNKESQEKRKFINLRKSYTRF